MGRKGDGVEIRTNSIRLNFVFEGETQRQTLVINGKPLAPTPANEKYARRIAVEIREKIRQGTFSMAEYFPASGSGGSLTLGGHMDSWLSMLLVEDSTKSGYASAVKFWKASPCNDSGTPLGDLALRAVRNGHIKRAIASRQSLTGKTVNNYVSVLRDALEQAVTDKLLTENPAAEIPRAKHQKPPPDPFTPEEREAIIAGAHKWHAGQVVNMIEFWFWTGPRTSEIFALRWGNIDFFGGNTLIAEAIVKGKRKGTKTSTERQVRHNSRSKAALTRQKDHTYLAGNEVFHDPRYGTPWVDERAFRRSYWTPLLKRLGIRYRRPYNMRHTYATAMLMAGMTPAFCAKQMGHSVEMFLTTYAKWLDGGQNDLEMARLEAAIGNAKEAVKKGVA